MKTELTQLKNSTRLLLEAELKPVQGDTFQPTGFADMGAAVYQSPEGHNNLKVESEQSIANHMESVCWDENSNDFIPSLQGIPFINVKNKAGNNVTNTVNESHRLASAYVVNTDWFENEFVPEVGDLEDASLNQQEARKRFYNAVLKYDPNSLLHGIFISLPKKVRPKISKLQRALIGKIDAENVNVVSSGGVRNDVSDPTGKLDGRTGSGNGYGHCPFPRYEYVAEKITARFNLDVSQILSYGLNEKSTDFMILFALFKIEKLLSTELRLRTACDLERVGMSIKRPENFQMPSIEDLESDLVEFIQNLKTEGDFAPITEVIWRGGK